MRLNWPELMRAGVHGLSLRPAEFWTLTPAELALMLGRGGGNAPMQRDQLVALMMAYPDDRKGMEDDRH